MARSRSAVEDQYIWNLSPLFEGVDAWETAFARLEDDIEAAEALGPDAIDDLLEVLERRDALSRRLERLSTYANLKASEDVTAQRFEAMTQRTASLGSRLSAAFSFLDTVIAEMDAEALDAMVAETDGLERYEHYLADVRRLAPHILSLEEEQLMSRVSEVLYGTGDVYGQLTNADIAFPVVEGPDGEEHTVTQNTFPSLQRHDNRAFRKTVYEEFYDTFNDFRHTFAAAYTDSVRTDVVLARIRGYDAAREAALDRNDIPIAVYDALVETVQENLKVLHRHMRMKQQYLDVDRPRPWDVYVPLVSETPEVPYGEAQEHILAAIEPLGADYVARARSMLDDRRVDVYETENKRSGAFSAGAYDGPSYVLMNYQADVPSMYTLAHELGHAMHKELATEEQPYVYSHYPIFSAEIASTTNEILLTRHLMEHGDAGVRRQALEQFVETMRSTLYRQTLFAAFEQQVHARVEQGGGPDP